LKSWVNLVATLVASLLRHLGYHSCNLQQLNCVNWVGMNGFISLLPRDMTFVYKVWAAITLQTGFLRLSLRQNFQDTIIAYPTYVIGLPVLSTFKAH